MRLVMLCELKINGQVREKGETLEVTDPQLITALLEAHCAQPADPQALAAWLATRRLDPPNWVTGWRRR